MKSIDLSQSKLHLCRNLCPRTVAHVTEVMFSLRKPIFVVVEILFDVLDITAIRLGKLLRGHDSDAAVFQNLQKN